MNFKNTRITIEIDEEKGFKSHSSQNDSMDGLRTVFHSRSESYVSKRN